MSPQLEKRRRQNSMRKKTVISALFLDYDGTISPIGVSRERAQLTPLVRQALQKIAKVIPIAVVTTKDMRFIQKRAPFAWAWAPIGGVEIKIGDRVLSPPQAVRGSSFVALLERIETEVTRIDDSIYIERKALSDGRLVAFCVDWRLAKDWETARRRLHTLVEPFEEQGFKVLRYTGRPYIDIYLERVDKGQAFLTLRRELKVKGPIMYLGDSELDNPAFNLAEISIGVLHKETPSKLDCEFFVHFRDIGAFFQELWRNNLTFDSNSRWIVRNEGRKF